MVEIYLCTLISIVFLYKPDDGCQKPKHVANYQQVVRFTTNIKCCVKTVQGNKI